jgi:hypothetical protein
MLAFEKIFFRNMDPHWLTREPNRAALVAVRELIARHEKKLQGANGSDAEHKQPDANRRRTAMHGDEFVESPVNGL